MEEWDEAFHTKYEQEIRLIFEFRREHPRLVPAEYRVVKYQEYPGAGLFPSESFVFESSSSAPGTYIQ